MDSSMVERGHCRNIDNPWLFSEGTQNVPEQNLLSLFRLVLGCTKSMETRKLEVRIDLLFMLHSDASLWAILG